MTNQSMPSTFLCRDAADALADRFEEGDVNETMATWLHEFRKLTQSNNFPTV